MSFTDKQLVEMTLKDAQTELSNELYAASRIIERLERVNGVKRISGNSHHIRQKIAEFGMDLLAGRWLGSN